MASGKAVGLAGLLVEGVENASVVWGCQCVAPYSWRNQRNIDITGVMPEPAVTNSNLLGTGWGGRNLRRGGQADDVTRFGVGCNMRGHSTIGHRFDP